MGPSPVVAVRHPSGVARTWKHSWDSHVPGMGWLCDTGDDHVKHFWSMKPTGCLLEKLLEKMLPLYEQRYGKRPFSSLGLPLSLLTLEQIYMKLSKFNI